MPSRRLNIEPGIDAVANLVAELSELARAAQLALNDARNPQLLEPLVAIDREAQRAKRAWSGSNIGYHAIVYYDGLEPPPPNAPFSAEWGLEERWPINTPDPGWRPMDHQQVMSQLLASAKVDDTEALDSSITALRSTFELLQERAIGLLNTALRRNNDPFIQRQLDRIEKLIAASPSTIAQSLASDGTSWSRDSLAVSQGRRVAPHQELFGLVLARKVVDNGLVALERALSEAAMHLNRDDTTTPERKTDAIRIFIGHGRSPAWRELKDFLNERLGLAWEEFNRISPAGVSHTSRLQEMIDSASFAFLVLTAEDEQKDETMNPRLNVVHEAGLFQGRLGFAKAIVLLEDGCEEFSNIHGLGQIRFSAGKISSCFEEVRRVLEREGMLSA
jgi:predicted nucleotide-binding protein